MSSPERLPSPQKANHKQHKRHKTANLSTGAPHLPPRKKPRMALMTQSEFCPGWSRVESVWGVWLGVICVICGSASLPTASHPPRDLVLLVPLVPLVAIPPPAWPPEPSPHGEIQPQEGVKPWEMVG